MVKRFTVLLLFIVLITSVSYAEKMEKNYFLMINPRVSAVLDVNDVMRGVGLSTQISINLLFIRLGGEAILEYDYRFHVNSATFLAQLGLGKNFWFSAGYTMPFATPYLDDLGTRVEYEFGGLPNTFGLGFRIPVANLGFARLAAASQILYVVNYPVGGSAIDIDIMDLSATLMGLLSGFKGYFSIELSFGI
jgi:hypothetical protein